MSCRRAGRLGVRSIPCPRAVQPRRPVGSASPTRSPSARRSCAASAASPTPTADERATRLAHHLADRGIGPGDHVALYLYNGTEYLEGDARRVQAARGPDQRQLPLRRGRAALPARRLPTPRRSCSTASSRRSSPRSAATCRCLRLASSRSTTAPHGARRRSARADYEARARGGVARARLRAALRRRPLHPLHRRHDRDAQGRDVARRGHLLRRARRRRARRRADHDPRADRRATLDAAPALPPGVPVHARHRALDGVQHALRRRHGRDLARSALRRRCASGG